MMPLKKSNINGHHVFVQEKLAMIKGLGFTLPTPSYHFTMFYYLQNQPTLLIEFDSSFEVVNLKRFSGFVIHMKHSDESRVTIVRVGPNLLSCTLQGLINLIPLD